MHFLPNVRIMTNQPKVPVDEEAMIEEKIAVATPVTHDVVEVPQA